MTILIVSIITLAIIGLAASILSSTISQAEETEQP